MGTAPAFTSVSEAMDMVQAGLSYLAAADAAQLPAATQAECLRGLERAGSVLTAARASMLAGFTAGQGYADDAAYSARSWLIHHTHITPGAAVGHTAWAKRTGTHPRVLAALAAGQVSESVGRQVCLWTGKLPEKYRDESDELLIAAAGLGVEELAALFGEMYERARGDLPDQDPGQDFADRGVKLATTFGGAGVVHGDLTPECAEVLGRVLDALGAPAGAEDDRTKEQRYHDALAEAMRWLVKCIVMSVTPRRCGCGTCDRPRRGDADHVPQQGHSGSQMDPVPAKTTIVQVLSCPVAGESGVVHLSHSARSPRQGESSARAVRAVAARASRAGAGSMSACLSGTT
jgi:hypothetical protein